MPLQHRFTNPPPRVVSKTPCEMPPTDLDAWTRTIVARVDTEIARRLPGRNASAARLVEAMRYTMSGGGKRIRALLCEAAGEAWDGPPQALDTVAAAVEMIHACMLVHDDLPAMDNDVMRRGKPTVHVRYDEGTAILVGDALQCQAFLTLSAAPLPAERRMALIHELAVAIGPFGAAGGQSIDLLQVGRTMNALQLEQMHCLKTGALIGAAVRMGALCGIPDDRGHAAEFRALHAYGEALGLAFQIIDDILDVTGDSVALGKTAGKDAKHGKPTYVSILGLDESRSRVAKLHSVAHAALVPFTPRTRWLAELADRIAGWAQ